MINYNVCIVGISHSHLGNLYCMWIPIWSNDLVKPNKIVVFPVTGWPRKNALTHPLFVATYNWFCGFESNGEYETFISLYNIQGRLAFYIYSMYIYWTAKETQMFVQIQFNHITTKNSFVTTVQRVKTKFGQNVLWTFDFFNLYSLVQSLHFATHASSKQNSQRRNMVNFDSIKHRKFNLRFFCCSVYISNHNVQWAFPYYCQSWNGHNTVFGKSDPKLYT